MKQVLALFFFLYCTVSVAGGINLFGKFVIFSDGEFYNPYEMNESERDTLSIRIDRACQSHSCSGNVIISPLVNPKQLSSQYNTFAPSEVVRSSCASNFILKTYGSSILSVYKEEGYNYFITFAGAEKSFYRFEKMLCE
ncbi:hypothetical protein [Neptuniibacter pectenicola]|uniref:hypothetical protein n=1 Tax=Neptuniibacter pectenicola TaxID=1806669 RepID=UPI000832734F|nr:hypothetical protein [Neptuniibacter pectenicola]